MIADDWNDILKQEDKKLNIKKILETINKQQSSKVLLREVMAYLYKNHMASYIKVLDTWQGEYLKNMKKVKSGLARLGKMVVDVTGYYKGCKKKFGSNARYTDYDDLLFADDDDYDYVYDYGRDGYVSNHWLNIYLISIAIFVMICGCCIIGIFGVVSTVGCIFYAKNIKNGFIDTDQCPL